MTMPPDLVALQREIHGYAREYGLDFFDTIFEMVDYEKMNQVAAYGGYPTRYPHWRFGMEYEHLSKSYAYGLHRIYELVINNDPCYAYLLESNGPVDQKMVMAHVYAHCDFFKNNFYFSHTNRKMIDQMANHATRVRRYIERHGVDTVEQFIDACLSIEDQIDPFSPFIEREESRRAESDGAPPTVRKMKSKDYMQAFINPPEFLESQRRKIAADARRAKKFPDRPVRDLMRFLYDHSPLDNWQRDVLSIIREEAYYFAPQRQTKIMNEGWATYWHSKIMTERALRDGEVIDYADHHSGTVSSGAGRLNPYKIGVELYRDIEDCWNRGRFGPEFDRCEDRSEREAWDLHLGLGREKVFEVRRLYNDITFIDTFLTEDFCRRHKLFTFAYDSRKEAYTIKSREFAEVKRALLFQLTNGGRPFIFVTDANYHNRGELYLTHRHEGVDLRQDYAKETLRNVNLLWHRPVHLETVVEGTGKILTFDGNDFGENDVRSEAGKDSEKQKASS
jgi:stage V sporulation protein R